MSEYEVDPAETLDQDDVQRFDPRPFLRKIGSADYLDVKWRLVWLRKVDPNAVITTELVREGDFPKADRNGNVSFVPGAMFKATVTLATGASATGYGTETINDFPEPYEKSETKAIGRALASLGFGTQFAPDLSEGNRIVDSPVQRPSAPIQRQAPPPRNAPPTRQQQMPPQRPETARGGPGPVGTARFPNQGRPAAPEPFHPQGPPAGAGDPNAATDRQLGLIARKLTEMGHDPNAVDWDDLTKREASAYIEALMQGRLPDDIAHALGVGDA